MAAGPPREAPVPGGEPASAASTQVTAAGAAAAPQGPCRAASGRSLTLSVRADPASVRAALVAATDCLARHGVGPEALGRVELALAEALNNIVEHALAGRPGAEIGLTLHCGLPVWLDCELRDDGCPMPGGLLPRGALPLPLPGAGALPEGGFGWFLIRTLAENLRYRREGQTNLLSFRIRLAPA
ncbi:MAG: ATP-binding protein [Rhodobacteraceae bacterium]|nr:ATP-binding protein [Paracoccaceae bacterium]